MSNTIEFVFPTSEAASACMSACDQFAGYWTTRQYGCPGCRMWVDIDYLKKEDNPNKIGRMIMATASLFGGRCS